MPKAGGLPTSTPSASGSQPSAAAVAATSAASGLGGFKFATSGSAAAPSTSQPVSSSVAPSAPAATSTQATTAPTTSAAAPSVQQGPPRPPSEITGKDVEDIIRQWSDELQVRTATFRKQAEALGEWDRRIISNRNVLIKVESEVAKVVESQHTLERQLELIETHQQEVERALDSIEDEAERLYQEERPGIVEDDAAATRDKMYQQAEFVEEELERLGEKLRETIQNINAAQGGDLDVADGASPLDLVVRILNNQLSSLLWIDEKSGELSGRIQTLLSDRSSYYDPGFVGSRMRGA